MAATMKHGFCLAIGLLASGAAAEPVRGPVLVELFTSQGCSSCPPADLFLHELADRRDVIALSLHVDYWDYLGWKDRFGSLAHSDRQRAYAAAFNDRMVYTPQIIVEGKERLVGSQVGAVLSAIETRLAEPETARVALKLEGDRIVVDISSASGEPDAALVLMTWYTESERVSINAGENAGREAVYRNVVRGWRTLGAWSGEATRIETLAPEGADAVVVILQQPDGGPVLCSERIDLK